MDVPITTGGYTAELATELDKAKARIAQLKPVETITVLPHGELLKEVEKRHAEDFSVRMETSA